MLYQLPIPHNREIFPYINRHCNCTKQVLQQHNYMAPTLNLSYQINYYAPLNNYSCTYRHWCIALAYQFIYTNGRKNQKHFKHCSSYCNCALAIKSLWLTGFYKRN